MWGPYVRSSLIWNTPIFIRQTFFLLLMAARSSAENRRRTPSAHAPPCCDVPSLLAGSPLRPAARRPWTSARLAAGVSSLRMIVSPCPAPRPLPAVEPPQLWPLQCSCFDSCSPTHPHNPELVHRLLQVSACRPFRPRATVCASPGLAPVLVCSGGSAMPVRRRQPQHRACAHRPR